MNLSRLAVNGLFAINGFAYANWMARLPDFQEVYGMDNGTLGMVLLCHAVGALIAMPISGVLIVKYGSRNITVWSGFLFVIMTPLLPLMPNVLTLGLWYGLMGSASGMLDVSMNAQAVLVERQMNKPIMSSFHGVFSAGMMVGAGVAAVAIGQQLNLLQHLLIIAIIGLPLVTWSSRNLVADAQQQNTVEEDSHFRWPARSLWGIGLVAFCCMLGEGSMADWSTIYMENFALADEAIAPLGLAAFSTAMMIGRFMGDRARQ
ncbi:MAG: MFS transporter [Bacteroidota bacterium]